MTAGQLYTELSSLNPYLKVHIDDEGYPPVTGVLEAADGIRIQIGTGETSPLSILEFLKLISHFEAELEIDCDTFLYDFRALEEGERDMPPSNAVLLCLSDPNFS